MTEYVRTDKLNKQTKNNKLYLYLEKRIFIALNF